MRWDDGYGNPTARASNAVFGVTADLIDIRDRVVFGVRQNIDVENVRSIQSIAAALRWSISSAVATSACLAQRAGLGRNGASDPAQYQFDRGTDLSGDGRFCVDPGFSYRVDDDYLLAGSVLDIRRYGDAVPDMPYSAFGTLELAC